MKTLNTVLIVLALILIVAGGWTYLAFQRDLSASRNRLAGASTIIGGHMLVGHYDEVAAEIAALLKMADHAPVP